MAEKERMIQEYVPGKQLTLAHIIASPNADIYTQLGISTSHSAIGIMTITPSEAAIIASDIATKASHVEIGFLDRFSGSVVISGDVGAVEAALEAVIVGLVTTLGFASIEVTRT